MKIKTVTIGVLAAVVSFGAYADDDAATLLQKKTVASKKYVDDTFQPKIVWDGQTSVDPDLSLVGVNMQHAIAPDLHTPLKVDAQLYPAEYYAFGGSVTNWNSSRDGDLQISIPSIQFVGEAVQSKQSTIPASNLPLGVVLMPTSNAGVPDYRFIIPGLDMIPDGNTDPHYNTRNWALFGGDISNDEVVVILDDMSHQYNPDLGWEDISIYTNDVLYSPASLKLVSDVWNESQRKIPASGYAAAANGAAAAVAYTNGNGNATTDWLNAAVKGTGIITKTTTAGQIGERKIVEEADVANYAGTALEKISVPTMGAVMAAITANQVTLPTGTAGNVVTYDANGAVGGSVAVLSSLNNYNAANDSGKLINAAAAVEYVNAHSPTIPAPTGDCLNAANHCALVTTYANGAITYAWTVMAK